MHEFERIYNEKILPLVELVVAVCTEHGISFAMVFPLDDDNHRFARAYANDGSIAVAKVIAEIERMIKSDEMEEQQ